MNRKTSVAKQQYKLDKKVFNVISLYDNDNDLQYWKTRTPHQRLKSLELTRQIRYGYGHSHPRFQRVYKIIKLKQS